MHLVFTFASLIDTEDGEADVLASNSTRRE